MGQEVTRTYVPSSPSSRWVTSQDPSAPHSEAHAAANRVLWSWGPPSAEGPFALPSPGSGNWERGRDGDALGTAISDGRLVTRDMFMFTESFRWIFTDTKILKN